MNNGKMQSAWTPSEAEQKNVLEEYKTLRTEILNHQQFVHQINTAGITLGAAVAVLVTLGGTSLQISKAEKAAFLFGLALFYLPLVMAQVYRRRKEMRIGRYIEIIIEPRLPGLYWEGAWHREQHVDVMRLPAVFEGSPLVLLQLMYGGSACWYLWQESPTFALLCSLILVAGIAIEVWQLAYRTFAVSHFEAEWHAFKSKRFSTEISKPSSSPREA